MHWLNDFLLPKAFDDRQDQCEPRSFDQGDENTHSDGSRGERWVAKECKFQQLTHAVSGSGRKFKPYGRPSCGRGKGAGGVANMVAHLPRARLRYRGPIVAADGWFPGPGLSHTSEPDSQDFHASSVNYPATAIFEQFMEVGPC
jgi:hypothetical protein